MKQRCIYCKNLVKHLSHTLFFCKTCDFIVGKKEVYEKDLININKKVYKKSKS